MPRHSLEQSISALASEFAHAIAKTIRDASLGELTGYVSNGVATRGRKKARTPRLGWPKCPVCGKNAWPRGKGYCFEHSKAAAGKAAKSTRGKRRGKAAKARAAATA